MARVLKNFSIPPKTFSLVLLLPVALVPHLESPALDLFELLALYTFFVPVYWYHP